MPISHYPVIARAHTNIALIKYWGKANEKLIIPENNSLSMTLDNFYTDTSVQFSQSLTHDELILNHQLIDDSTRITKFLDLVRKRAGINFYAKVESINHVPTSAGMASSASAFSALAAASSKAAGLNLNFKDLSRLARRGSGSASRSIYGGFVEWKKGTNDSNSYAVSIQEHPIMDIRLITVILNRSHKRISSREGMKRSVQTSPYYDAWKKTTASDLQKVKNAISKNNFNQLGQVAESNAMKMHALTLSAWPDFMYFKPDTIKVINKVKSFRDNGINCYFTMDAGPNVIIVCLKKDSQFIKSNLSKTLKSDNIVVSGPGEGVKFLHKIKSEGK
ncbi:diphosphomevalonate decarboxylase [Philodulcilactobacillus myokoensis]|uniref:diphosphomevalonate decarboxylase n=1 Tax=Philodulcilactobacillus myokoensis TaxID=2929573 RepID=A0A9W6ET75_9LACO|nr:diphosphomevalonate decarboxylase [Philodulcilactobacillus myokoensis]GLB46839.1 diphosphomevalonate decarboxylase [Philodulcilactobacillus myokoensis]